MVVAIYGVRGIGSLYYIGYASTHVEFIDEGALWAVVSFTIFASTGRGLLDKVKVTVVSAQGKEAVVAILERTAFFGEGCLAGQPRRMATVSAVTEAVIARLEKSAIVLALRNEPAFAQFFMVHLLSRSVRAEADLVDQLFNSSEKRLARLLLLLANFGKEGRPEPVIAKISQETLAQMIGTTRARVSFFMNKFRKLGLIEYNGRIEVHSSLLNVVLHESPEVWGDALGPELPQESPLIPE